MGNEPLEVNAKGRKVNRRQNTKGRKVNRRRRNVKGWKVNRRRNTKGQISATKMGLLATKWAYRRQNGLIGDGMGLSATVFVLVWVWNHRERLSASVAGAVTNGSTIGFGFGFGPLRMVISDGLGSYRRRCGKLSATVWELSVTVNGDLLGFYR